ncbi:LysR family transcriptional regulator [Paenibacillus ehimensis]|uniref:LysR family transcriptional regulator n=1 Tax=Paenibacillus ehimensis TaxID=79264 RepID=A0ABT8V6J3_9BACL|nr:LysR family transcriptional regulator [Paenibacillus ehimensis]MDO3675902.1 LysR family transcriptional regulator [Paenibacillus ehimensis]MEC0208525.1 LysR family transcriptional regulator [Paenibacillus ehimensis]
MSLAKYEVFSTVVELGSLTRTAEKLGLTQSAVSHAIASLESEWGFALLTRGRAGIGLTPNGTRVLKHVRDIIQRSELLKQEVASIQGLETGTVRIGTFTSISTQWLPGIMKRFQAEHPAIEIKLLEGDYDEINDWITSGAVDFGFLSLTAARPLDIIPLTKDNLLCIVPDESPYREMNVMSLAQLQAEPFIMPKWGKESDLLRIIKINRLSLNIKYEVLEDQAIMAMVKNGLGISILPEMVLYEALDGIHMIGLEGDPYRTIVLAAVSFKQLSPAARKFKKHIAAWLSEQQVSL